jgi:hypothetical protein
MPKVTPYQVITPTQNPQRIVTRRVSISVTMLLIAGPVKVRNAGTVFGGGRPTIGQSQGIYPSTVTLKVHPSESNPAELPAPLLGDGQTASQHLLPIGGMGGPQVVDKLIGIR